MSTANGETKEGEGRNAEGVTTTSITELLSAYREASIEVDRMVILFVTEGTYQVNLERRGAEFPDEPIYVSVLRWGDDS